MDKKDITPNEAVEILNSELHLQTVRRTLLNYERDELMTTAWRSENGREAYYTFESLAEFYASWKLLHGDFISGWPGFSQNDKIRLSPKFVAFVRHVANELIVLNLENKSGYEAFELFELLGFGVDQIDDSNFEIISGYARTWLSYKNKALSKLNKNTKGGK